MQRKDDCKCSHCITVTLLPTICCQSLNYRYLNATCDSDSCLWGFLNMIIAIWYTGFLTDAVLWCVYLILYINAETVLFFLKLFKS